MSILSADIHAELSRLLQGLQSADNGVRSQAEEHLQNNWTNSRPEVLLMGLAEQIQVAGDNAVSKSSPFSQLTQVLSTNYYSKDPIFCCSYISTYCLEN